MWLKCEGEPRLVNLSRADYLDVRRWPAGKHTATPSMGELPGPWCVVSVFIIDTGRVLSMNDTVIVLRSGKNKNEMITAFEEIQRLMGASVIEKSE